MSTIQNVKTLGEHIEAMVPQLDDDDAKQVQDELLLILTTRGLDEDDIDLT